MYGNLQTPSRKTKTVEACHTISEQLIVIDIPPPVYSQTSSL